MWLAKAKKPGLCSVFADGVSFYAKLSFLSCAFTGCETDLANAYLSGFENYICKQYWSVGQFLPRKLRCLFFITDASLGTGRARAEYFAAKGWEVIATIFNPAKVGELAKMANIWSMALDVTDSAQI